MTPINRDIQLDDLPAEYRSVAEIIGLDAYLRLVDRMAGSQIYVPKWESVARAARDRAIRAGFNGVNYDELARTHGLTVSWVRSIVHSGEARKPASTPMQGKLF
jgi:Mor family transcriptional regulator